MNVLLLTFVFFTSCEKNENELPIENIDNTFAENSDIANHPLRPTILGTKKNNPFSVANMQAALDTLKAHPSEENGCMRAPGSEDDIVITATDLYVRFLPADSAQYKELMADTTLTLFDHPLDYEITQVGDYYFDPTATGGFTWYYTRVPVNYTPNHNAKYEVLSDLFLYENSEYYSEEVDNDSVNAVANVGRAKVAKALNLNDALKTIQTISFFLTGNGAEITKNDASINSLNGMQRLKKAVKKRFLFWTWTDYEYFPSGYLSVKSYYKMDNGGNTLNYTTLTDVPIKGVQLMFWSWFTWNTTTTDANGYYESATYYDQDPYYYIVFKGNNGNNYWTFDRVILGAVCLWSQKHAMGHHSRDGYTTTIAETSGAWDACITSNAFYDFMTICDKNGLARPPMSLKVALRESGGSFSTPLLQNHFNTFGAGVYAGLAAITVAFPPAAVVTAPVAGLAGLISIASPDLIISGGNLDYDVSNYSLLHTNFKKYVPVIWHELSHASNFQSMKESKGYYPASLFWSSLVETEAASFLSTSGYGKKGDSNWQQVALCEGWASFIEWKTSKYYLAFDRKSYLIDYPDNYYLMYDELVSVGCSLNNIEKSLNVKTFNDYKTNLCNLYQSNTLLQNSIVSIVDRYYNK